MASLDSVINEIRNYLNIDESVEIKRDTRIASLTGTDGERLEPSDLLGILHNLGIRALDYCSGERLNRLGYNMLQYVVWLELDKEDSELLIKRKKETPNRDIHDPVITTTEVAERITPGYLLRMTEYDADITKRRKTA